MYFMTFSFSTRFTEISKCSLAYQTFYRDPDKMGHTSNTLRYDLRPAVGGPFHNLLTFLGFHLEPTYEIPSGPGTLERCAFEWDNQSSAESWLTINVCVETIGPVELYWLRTFETNGLTEVLDIQICDKKTTNNLIQNSYILIKIAS